MASTCPNCGKKLHIYDIKAECSQCGVSIPNFNWEARLEEDNIRAEKKFSAFYKKLNRVAYSIWGTKLRIARIIFSFIPIIGYILPWATLKSDTKSIGIDLFGITSDVSLIDLFKNVFGNISLYLTNMAYEGYSGPITCTLISVLLMVLCLLFMVIAFFLIIFKAKRPKTKTMVVFDTLGVLSAVASAVVFTLGVSNAKVYPAFNFGDIPVYNADGAVAWGFYIALVLLVVALVINILVAKAPAKSDETLEQERLARKAEKEEKERQKEIEREKARIENEKRAAEEEAQKVAEAKAKLAEMEAKEKK